MSLSLLRNLHLWQRNTKIRFRLFAMALEFKYTLTDRADMPASGTSIRKPVKVTWSIQTGANIEAV